MHSLIPLLSGFVVAGTLLHAAEPQALDDGFLSRIRTEAARNHPSAIAGKYRATAAAHEARAVRLWNDPMFGIGFMGANEMMRMDDGDVMVGFEQALPKPGMFAAERRKMEAMQRAEFENSGGAALAAGAEAARAAIELALADESITLQQAQIDWMTKMVENARQMAADPMGRGRQYLAARIRALDGTRAAGFVLSRSPSAGKWEPDKYRLAETTTATTPATVEGEI